MPSGWGAACEREPCDVTRKAHTLVSFSLMPVPLRLCFRPCGSLFCRKGRGSEEGQSDCSRSLRLTLVPSQADGFVLLSAVGDPRLPWVPLSLCTHRALAP